MMRFPCCFTAFSQHLTNTQNTNYGAEFDMVFVYAKKNGFGIVFVYTQTKKFDVHKVWYCVCVYTNDDNVETSDRRQHGWHD